MTESTNSGDITFLKGEEKNEELIKTLPLTSVQHIIQLSICQDSDVSHMNSRADIPK